MGIYRNFIIIFGKSYCRHTNASALRKEEEKPKPLNNISFTIQNVRIYFSYLPQISNSKKYQHDL